MHTTTKVETTHTITMNDKEMKWLKGLMQNPLGIDIWKELEDDKFMRLKFWNTLNDPVKYCDPQPEIASTDLPPSAPKGVF